MSKQLATRPGALLAPQLDYILLDGSGSMKSKWWPMMASIDAFVSGLKTSNLNSHMILSTFWSPNASGGLISRDEPLSEWKPLVGDDAPGAGWGGTPLYDAINSLGRHIRDLVPQRASILIVTDGDENCSDTSVHQAKGVLDWLRAHGYQVTFLGCDFNNSEQAKLLGADKASAVGVHKTLLVEAATALAAKRAAYGHYGTPMHFTTDEQTQFGGLLGAPK